MENKTNVDIKFKATKVEYPEKTIEEIQAEVDAFNKAQRDKLEEKDK